VCSDLNMLRRELRLGAGAVLVAEEAIANGGGYALDEILARQAPWSDLPVLVLTHHGADSPAVVHALERLSNVTLLERPTRVAALLSAVRTALRARQRQYQIRSHLAEHDRTQRALAESEERLRRLANAVPSIVWSAAQDGTLTYVNNKWFAFSGQLPGKTVQDWSHVLHPDDRERWILAWERALREGTDYEIEVRHCRRDGQYRWFLTRAVPARDEDGDITGWFGSTTDIHDRKQAEEALREADRRKDEFLATLAHELRNP
jgi:PAS domain S-box-containing protein